MFSLLYKNFEGSCAQIKFAIDADKLLLNYKLCANFVKSVSKLCSNFELLS